MGRRGGLGGGGVCLGEAAWVGGDGVGYGGGRQAGFRGGRVEEGGRDEGRRGGGW